MGPDERARHDAEADAFFAYFNNSSIALIAAVRAEQGGNLDAITAEEKAYGYWGRRMAEQAERAALRELAATRLREAQQERLNEIARFVPIAPTALDGQPAVLLPRPRIVIVSEEERAETEAWWRRLAKNQGAFTLRNQIRREIRAAEQDDRFAARANAAWQREQREFERAQWRAVTPTNRHARKVAARWAAISEDRALAIALAALQKQHPPQP